jgi:aminoglycoside 6'-N-acetyltransferase I
MTIRIRKIGPRDAARWCELRTALWPADHAEEVADYFRGELIEPVEVLFAEIDSAVVAHVELSIRNDIPGYESARVGFIEGLIEGLYVEPAHRHRGVARALLRASREWARLHDCTRFAGDREDRYIFDRSY